MKSLFEVIQHDEISDRNADRLIREVALQKPQHLMASLTPAVSGPALQRFDDMARAAFAAKHRLPADQLHEMAGPSRSAWPSRTATWACDLWHRCERERSQQPWHGRATTSTARRKMQLPPLTDAIADAAPAELLPYQHAAHSALESLRRETAGTGLRISSLQDTLVKKPGAHSTPTQRELT